MRDSKIQSGAPRGSGGGIAELPASYRAFTLRIAPELEAADLRLYIQPDDWPLRPNTLAYTTRGRHLRLRDALIRAGKWRGHYGSSVFFVPPIDEAGLHGLLLHELGHLLPATNPIPDVEPTAEDIERQDAVLQAWAGGMRLPGFPWQEHGARWIRRVLHLRHRASLLGVDVDLADIHVAGPAYGLSMPACYETALGSEMWYLGLRSFAEIEAEPLLPRFKRLFLQDCIEYVVYNLADADDS